MPPAPVERAPYVELGITSPFSFLRGASDSIELVLRALELGMDSIGIADRNTLAGVVRMHSACKGAGLKPLIGCRLDLTDAPSLLAYPIDREGYGRLSRLLSLGKMRAEKGECDLSLCDVAAHADGIAFIAWPSDDVDAFEGELPRLRDAIPSLPRVAASYLYRGGDVARIERIDRIARAHGCTILATNDVHYHAPDKRPLQDVMTCIREKRTIEKAGFLLNPNAERHLKSPEEMARLFARWPHAIAATREFADALNFSLDELRYEYPRESVPEGKSPQAYLEQLAWDGARDRWPEGVPDKVVKQLNYELPLIDRLDFARYFLTVHDIVAFARSLDPPILCQGRGSAANSAVCYCLGITAVDPSTSDLLFERFISEERREPPDIDVDFEHERREEVIQHIYAKYGRDRAGIAATVIHYRPRSAIREVGKVMGLSEDVCGALASTIWGHMEGEMQEARAADAGLDLSDPHLKRTVRLAQQMIGMPRHLSQHVGGFILTERPLTETVPVGNGAMDDRTFIEWDKDDIDELGILKIDVLALGMLTCIRKCFDLVRQHHGEDWELATVPPEEPAVYDMLCRGDSLGVFQVESRAQMNMLPRLKPRCFYDLVIEVAIVRPGPIQGDMVHPYLKRRNGRDPITFPCPAPEHGPPDELEKILGRTLGVPIFQEQAMKIAIDAANFSAEEANQLRKAMATFRSKGKIETLEEKMVGRMVKRGYDPDFAQRCFDQIKGFGEYGFPESHAASFAHLVYVSSWLRWKYPAAFAAALLNSQPMGFYAPAQIVRDGKEHGVEVLEVDVNHSDWDCTLEDGALRLGLRQVDGLHREAADRVVSGRPYASVEELRSRARVPVHAIQRLAAADAFRSMGLDRRAALWDSRALRQAPDLPLFAYSEAKEEGCEASPAKLPAMPLAEHVISDYQTVRLSLKAHPMHFLRSYYAAQNFVTAEQLKRIKDGKRLSMAGVVLIRQRPGTSKGVVFITIEDETGVANLVVWPKVFEKQRKIVMGARLMAVHGMIQRDPDSEVIHVVAARLEDHTGLLSRLSDDSLLPSTLEKADHAGSWGRPQSRHPRNVEIIPKSRDFH
ncbi:error-prone DNA polymerase [Sphingomonas sp. RG327]|uniref:Error-prone DNA polymerase n=1 Tax=Sphingomonas anseongensis TaxID=2908207 RepID=A0ABT0RG36_9SPHN|nr:error-prone DNA polymerase [Sphingomonas anseongensis]MCL6679193.1 error-prone DNA polymerase [Sphingomonas anseongensis]